MRRALKVGPFSIKVTANKERTPSTDRINPKNLAFCLLLGNAKSKSLPSIRAVGDTYLRNN